MKPKAAAPATESENPRSAELDRLSALDAVRLMQSEDRAIHAALEAAAPQIAEAVERVAQRLAAGGRMFYAGAGTSGRLGALDAAECPPTFRTPPEWVQALIAGGPEALTRAIEGAEDDDVAAAVELDRRGLSSRDVVVAIAASGTTPYARGALRHAREIGALAISLTCVPHDGDGDGADVAIRVVTGPEVLTGSTRLKAGTATKLVLNTLSTLVMVRLGRVYGHWMVAVDTRGNAKLRRRGVALVQRLTGLDESAAARALDAAGGEVRAAVLMVRRGFDRESAERELARHHGRLRDALGEG